MLQVFKNLGLKLGSYHPVDFFQFLVNSSENKRKEKWLAQPLFPRFVRSVRGQGGDPDKFFDVPIEKDLVSAAFSLRSL